ncbi:hypothetical protein ACJMK2_034484 [Sinanodonta woodiana]|uniref:Uncharacterized protein n=1 Tax=Sinanodonta woodiana TaxID=1069815 RepID=A0ABD3WRR9_SINWO
MDASFTASYLLFMNAFPKLRTNMDATFTISYLLFMNAFLILRTNMDASFTASYLLFMNAFSKLRTNMDATFTASYLLFSECIPHTEDKYGCLIYGLHKLTTSKTRVARLGGMPLAFIPVLSHFTNYSQIVPSFCLPA